MSFCNMLDLQTTLSSTATPEIMHWWSDGFWSVDSWLRIRFQCTMRHGLCIGGVELYALCIMALKDLIRMGARWVTGQSEADASGAQQLKCSVFTQYRNGEPRSQSDLRIYSCNLIGWWQQVLFLQSWEKTERLNTLIACAHAHVRNAHVSLQMRRRYIVTARYSDHIWDSPGPASDSLATLSASFDNFSCAPWKKNKLYLNLFVQELFSQTTQRLPTQKKKEEVISIDIKDTIPVH